MGQEVRKTPGGSPERLTEGAKARVKAKMGITWEQIVGMPPAACPVCRVSSPPCVKTPHPTFVAMLPLQGYN